MKLRMLLAVMVAAALAGCGGGIGPLPGGDDGGSTTREWTFTTGDNSTLAAYNTSASVGSVTNSVSITLQKDGFVRITSLGTVTGSATGTADRDGSFVTTSGTISASGTLTHQQAALSVWWPTSPLVKLPMLAPLTASGSYSAYRGTWTGTYKMSDNITHAMSLTVDSGGFVTGYLSEGTVTGAVYGRINGTAKSIELSIPFQNASQPGWSFTGSIDDHATPFVASGTIASNNLANHETGTWRVTK